MKLRLILTALLLTVTFATAPALVHAGGVKVEVCHIPPDDPENFHTINVSEKALDSHIAHGDLLGSCDIPAEERCDDGLYCTIDAFVPGTVTCDNSQQKCLDDDNDACTTEQFCDEENDVCGTVPLEVDDNNKCTVDSCNPDSGAVHAPIICNDGEVCNDPAVGCELIEEPVACPCWGDLPEEISERADDDPAADAEWPEVCEGDGDTIRALQNRYTWDITKTVTFSKRSLTLEMDNLETGGVCDEQLFVNGARAHADVRKFGLSAEEVIACTKEMVRTDPKLTAAGCFLP